ncbi:hypothetical protein [Nocardia sp. NPDC004260]
MSPGKFEVALDSLRADASVWARESAAMSDLGGRLDALRFNRLQAGLFQFIVDANDELVSKMSDRSAAASRRFAEVADTLRFCADTYEAEDAAGKHRIDNVW